MPLAVVMGRVFISLLLTMLILLSGCIDPLDPLDRNSEDELDDSNPEPEPEPEPDPAPPTKGYP